MVFARQWYKRKTTKLQIYWSSNVRKRYKRNAFFVDLHRAKKYLQISRQKLPANFENLITRYDSLIILWITSLYQQTVYNILILLHPIYLNKNLSFWLKFHFGIEMRISRKTHEFTNIDKIFSIKGQKYMPLL